MGLGNMGLRGYMYTLTVVFLMVPSLLFIISYLETSQAARGARIDKVISDQLKQFEENIEIDVQKATRITAIRAILSASDYVVMEGDPLTNATECLETLMMDGKVYGSDPMIRPLMRNNTMRDWEHRFMERAGETGFELLLDYSELEVLPYDSFNLAVHLEYDINVTTRMNRTRIDKTLSEDFIVPIYKVEDPIFALHTAGYVRRLVVQSPHPFLSKIVASGTASSGDVEAPATFVSSEKNVSKILVIHNITIVEGDASYFAGVISNTTDLPVGFPKPYLTGVGGSMDIGAGDAVYMDEESKKGWLLTNFKNDTGDGYYHSSDDGGSFLDRLEGNLEASSKYEDQAPYAIGLESFIDTIIFTQAGLPVRSSQSVVDYLYFDTKTHTGKRVRGMNDWFLLDTATANKYNVSELQ